MSPVPGHPLGEPETLTVAELEALIAQERHYQTQATTSELATVIERHQLSDLIERLRYARNRESR